MTVRRSSHFPDESYRKDSGWRTVIIFKSLCIAFTYFTLKALTDFIPGNPKMSTLASICTSTNSSEVIPVSQRIGQSTLLLNAIPENNR